MTYLELQRERLKKFLAAEEAILINQEYQIGSRKYTRTDLSEVRKMINALLDAGVTLEDGDAIKFSKQKRAVFVD